MSRRQAKCRRTSRRLRCRLVPRALALALVVLAVPIAGSAAAKGPIYQIEARTESSGNPCVPPARNVPPPLVQPRVPCNGYSAQAQSTDDGGGIDAGVVAGGAAVFALITVGGVLVAIRRRGPQPARPVTQH
jgi:hypothetical protein